MAWERKVFGVGWAKTGTTTLGECMRLLGSRHQSAMFSLVPDLEVGRRDVIVDAAEPFDSVEDWPWLLVYRELDVRYPGSRFVLTTRDSDAWLGSYRNMLASGASSPEADHRRRVLYGLPFPDVSDEDLVRRYVQHNADVRAWFSDRPDALLEVDWGRGDGWAELCAFLDVDPPDAPFPHANRGDYVTGPRVGRGSG